MPNPIVFSEAVPMTVRLSTGDIHSTSSPAALSRIRERCEPQIQEHVAALQSMGISDISTLGKLEISGNVIPQPGVLKPATTFEQLLGPQTMFSSAFRVKPGLAGPTPQLEKIGGHAHYLKTDTFPSTLAVTMMPSTISTISPRLFMPTPIVQIPIAYWAATEIIFADNTNVIFQQPHHWLVLIAEKITIGDNVTFTWEQVQKEIPEPPDKPTKRPDPATSVYMSGTDGAKGRDGDDDSAGRGPNGDDGPEIEIWTLDMNKLPSILIAGQDGFTGGKGQDGQDGQNGAKGRKWQGNVVYCTSGPGNGGDGGRGGNGGKGGRGGDGGHGGRFNLMAPQAVVTRVCAAGFYIDTKEGKAGQGGDGGQKGIGGSGGKAGNNREPHGCPTDFGKKGNKGRNGSPGIKGDPGEDGDHYADAEKLYPVDPNIIIEAFSKPAITNLSAEFASEGDEVTVIGTRFQATDKTYVADVEAQTTYYSDTLLTFITPRVMGGRQKAVYVKQQDGTQSNNATLHILPKIRFAEYGGKKSTDIPPARFTPGTNATLVGSGFAPTCQIKIRDEYIPNSDIQFHDPTKIEFKVKRPASTPANPEGEPVQIKIILDDGSASNTITIILDTYVMLVLGDSIQWGQGLREDLKFHSIVAEHIRNTRGDLGVYKTVLAHSGAIIGKGVTTQGTALNGEINTDLPTIFQQISNYDKNKSLVDLVLIDGGINDIQVTEIVNPVATSNLANLAKKYCYRHMKELLKETAEEFPHAKMIVTGYYQIVSENSDLSMLVLLLTGLGIVVGGVIGGPPGAVAGAIVGGVVSAAGKATMVSRSKEFWEESTKNIKAAINEINPIIDNGPRICFAEPDYKKRNAIFAADSWLWGIDGDLSPADHDAIGGVESSRCQVCEDGEEQYPNRVDETICKRASIGHPNKKGAIEYGRVIKDLL